MLPCELLNPARFSPAGTKTPCPNIKIASGLRKILKPEAIYLKKLSRERLY